MTKKEQKEKAQKEALRRRIADVFAGANGQAFGEDDWAGAGILSRVIPALRSLFSGPTRKYLFYLGNIHNYDNVETTTDFYFNHGVRADDQPQPEEEAK